ncbi:MAG: type II secretion system F family protein [Lachnospiraceae bacterium]|nr:type II secretion system F family protein [Lachnospiraceae bacterium]
MSYDKYRLNIKEITAGAFIWIMLTGILAYFFYRSFVAWVLLWLFFPLFLKYEKKRLSEKRRWKLTLEFKEMIRILSVNLQAGNSAETSFVGAYRDMKKMYGKSDMTRECEAIVRGLENNIVIENLVSEFAKRSCVDEIKEFAEVFAIAKRSGGNIREIIADTTEVIDMKIDMKREFKTLISSKRFEHRIMCVIPFAIIGYIGLTSPGYFDMFYHNPRGVLIMSVCLAVYIGAFLWGEKISNIKI